MLNNSAFTLLIILPIILCPFISQADNAFEDTIKAAESGDVHAQAVLGEMYRRGESADINYPEAFRWSKMAAEAGDPIGMYNFAVLLEKGICAEIDTKRAKELYMEAEAGLELSASKGDFRACVDLGNIYEMRYEDTTLYEEALKLYRTAADSGYSYAEYILGFKYYYGSVVEEDRPAGIEWLKKASENGCRPAQFLLGNILFNGKGINADTEEAQKWFALSESSNTLYEHNGFQQPGDFIIPDHQPPKYLFNIKEGSCGEACFWSVLYNRSENITQLEILRAGGSPGRGLRSYELHRVLDYYEIPHADKMYRNAAKFILKYVKFFDIFSDKAEHYRNSVHKEIIPAILDGDPVILGVKRYPDKIKWWDLDHFILLVGYNKETDEIIFNDFTERKRIKVEKLFNKRPGYSLLNRYHLVNYIVIERQ